MRLQVWQPAVARGAAPAVRAHSGQLPHNLGQLPARERGSQHPQEGQPHEPPQEYTLTQATQTLPPGPHRLRLGIISAHLIALLHRLLSNAYCAFILGDALLQ